MITVATFGSPSLIDEGLCAQADNYVSVKDGVPILDFSRYYKGTPQRNVHFLPSESSLPLIDHFLCGKTYSAVLSALGRRFRSEFLLEATCCT